MLKHSTMYPLKLLGVAALYALLIYVNEFYFHSDTIVNHLELASGLALAVLLIGGKRYAWGVLSGAILINVMFANSFWEAAIIASGDTLQALCGAWLITRSGGRFDLRLQSLHDYLRLILLGGCASIAIGALAVNTVLLVSGLLAPGNYFHSLIQWWMSDMLGVILIAPLILVWRRMPDNWLEPKRVAEAALVLGLTLLIGQAVFLDWFHDTVGQIARGYWIFLFVTWAAVRLGTHGVVIVLIITAVQALLGAIQGVGFFADDIAKTGLTNYWFYMISLSVVGMALATHCIDRKRLEQQLSRRLRHRDVMERITQISLNSTNVEELLGRVLDEMLAVFNADRAYFLYPCDPDAPSWSVPMERTRPEWPGAFAHGMVLPMNPEVAEVFRELLASTKPLPYGHAASRCVPAAVAGQFSVRSLIQMALRPRVGSPWVIGLHHCAQARAYDEDDLLIFGDIGLRVADALSSMIILENLRESEENLSRAQAVGQVGSWLLNIPTNRLEWSAETYRIFGLPQREAVNLGTFAAAIHPDDRDFVLKAWGEAMAGAPYDIEHRIVAGGQTRWIREHARIERDSEGRPLAGIGTVQDITERRKAEEELRTLSTAIEQSPLSVIMTDLDAKIRYVNPCFLNTSGYSREEAIGQNPRILQSGQTPKETYVEMWKALANGQAWHGELINKRKNGELYWEDAYIKPVIDSAGVTTHYVAVKLEITQRKQAEAKIAAINDELKQANLQVEEERAQLANRVAERTAQLLYANHAKDSFLATMSHEIRTPLGGLLGMMELISLSRLDDEQREMLQAARNSGQSLLHIVDDILDWSKIEAEKLVLAPQVASIPETLEKVANTYAQLASAKGLMLRQRTDSKLSTAHLFDPLRLSQILNNFTSNAIKFTAQGSVEISAELIAQHEGAELVRFCVKDTGIGIDKEQQARLFRHYEQGSADTARMYGGTGLGLAICRSLAELMGGAVNVESTPGSGSVFCFTVSLPVASPAAQRDLQLRQARGSGGDNTPDITPLAADNKRVLVVDDHPVNRKLLKQQLEQLGLHAEIAAYGIVALSLWWTGRFDIVITDCHMPEMDGYELTRSIREMEQHDGRQQVPIIAWTANVLAEEEERCRAAGMDDILTKPTDLADLRAMLLKWLAKADVPAAEAAPTKVSRPVGFVDAAPADTPIDFKVLKKIAKSPAAQVEMLREFNLYNRSDIANLNAALKDGNHAAVARAAHRIKGACRMVGALELEGICTAIEKAVMQGGPDGARKAAEASLGATVERLEAAVGKFIGGQ